MLIDDHEFLADPHAAYARLREAGPVVPVRDPNGLEYWLITRYAEAKAVLGDGRLSKDPRRAGSSLAGGVFLPMVNSDPPDHTRLRRLVTTAFSARRIESLRPRIERIADGLVDEFQHDATVDLMDAFAFPLPVLVICELLGVPPAHRVALRGWAARVLQVGDGDSPQARARRLATYFTRLVAAKRPRVSGAADAQPDLLSALICARDGEQSLSEDELVQLCVLLLIAGHETTTNLIGNAMLALLRHPEQLAGLRADPGLLPAAVEEVLRHDGPLGRATLRVATEDITVAGTRIPAGAVVSVGLAAANRDGSRFDHADRLDITRPDHRHLAFGHGVHFCLGAPLARMQGAVAIGTLLRRFPDLALDGEAEHWLPTGLARGLIALPLRLN